VRRTMLRRYRRRAANLGQLDWYFASRHGLVLYFIAANPGCTTGEIAEALTRSRGVISAIVSALRRTGLVNARREERRQHYTVNLDARVDVPGVPASFVLGDALVAFDRAGLMAAIQW
jgi:DNA-binding MarR family transcriptional regulator